jgi:hypothetical protein
MKSMKMDVDGFKAKLENDKCYKGLWMASSTQKAKSGYNNKMLIINNKKQ